MNRKRNKRFKDWSEYYHHQKAREPENELLREVFTLLKREKKSRARTERAIDLGCGRGHDTYALLKKGYEVVGVDASKEAFKLMRPIIPMSWRRRLITKCESFEHLSKLKKASLINAQCSVFFCKKSVFVSVWKKIIASLETEGIFCGNFLGRRDDWAKSPEITALSKRELKKMLKGFQVLLFVEREDDLGTLTGKEKHWHLYSVIARKIR